MKNISLGGASPPTSPRGSDSESDSEERMQYARDVVERNVRLDKYKAEMAAEKAKAAADKKAAAEKAARDQKSQREKDHKKTHLPFALKTHRLETSRQENPEKKALRTVARGKRHRRKSTFPNVALSKDVNPYFCYNNIFNKNKLQHAFKYINVLILIC
jgi:hypothetical protein